MLGEAHQLFDPFRVRVCPVCLAALDRTVEIEDGSCGLCHQPVVAGTSDLTLGEAASQTTRTDRNNANGASPDPGHDQLNGHSQGASEPVFGVSTELRATKKRLTERPRRWQHENVVLSQSRLVWWACAPWRGRASGPLGDGQPWVASRAA